MSEFSGPAIAAMAIGGLFAYGGITGKSPLTVIQAVVQGQPPASVLQSQGILPTSVMVPPGASQGSYTDTSTPGGVATASTGAQPIIAFLKSHNIPKHQIAGALGNIQVESGFNPANPNPSEGAIGYCQWEKGRRTALQAFAAARGKPETDGPTQLEFMWAELHGSEIAAYTLWRATTSASQAAAVWDAAYERSDGSARQTRIANAIAWEAKI